MMMGLASGGKTRRTGERAVIPQVPPGCVDIAGRRKVAKAEELTPWRSCPNTIMDMPDVLLRRCSDGVQSLRIDFEFLSSLNLRTWQFQRCHVRNIGERAGSTRGWIWFIPLTGPRTTPRGRLMRDA